MIDRPLILQCLDLATRIESANPATCNINAVTSTTEVLLEYVHRKLAEARDRNTRLFQGPAQGE